MYELAEGDLATVSGGDVSAETIGCTCIIGGEFGAVAGREVPSLTRP